MSLTPAFKSLIERVARVSSASAKVGVDLPGRGVPSSPLRRTPKRDRSERSEMAPKPFAKLLGEKLEAENQLPPHLKDDPSMANYPPRIDTQVDPNPYANAAQYLGSATANTGTVPTGVSGTAPSWFIGPGIKTQTFGSEIMLAAMMRGALQEPVIEPMAGHRVRFNGADISREEALALAKALTKAAVDAGRERWAAEEEGE